MKLSRRKLLKGCIYPIEANQILVQVEEVLKTWEPIWTPFVSAPIREELIRIVQGITDISCSSNGGYQNAERQRILIQRTDREEIRNRTIIPFKGIQIQGNFLFDRTEPQDFLEALMQTGLQEDAIGDIWITGDKGANAICTPEASKFLEDQQGLIRDVKIIYKSIGLAELHLPQQRSPRKISTVEASRRLDAISSAGFGLSRAKVINQIKQGKLRFNWHTTNNASRSLSIGDRLQLEGKGSLEVINLELTKRGRWRVELLKK